MSWTLGILIASVLSAQPAAPVRRVAVLDFQASWSADCVDRGRVSEARREQCEILRLFADRARGGALTVLRPPGFVVMTRENTAQILKDMGGACTEGECEVETARLLGASVVVSGEVTLLEGTYLVSLKVHDVTTAALLGTGDTRARTKLEAFDNVRAETERMLRSAVGLEGIAAVPPPVMKRVEPPPPPPPPLPPPPKVPAFVAAAEEPPATPEPEPADGSPRAHPWYFELGAGMRFVPSPAITLDGSAHRETLSEAASALRVGYSLSPGWALEATGIASGGPSASSTAWKSASTAELSASYKPDFAFSVGGAWTPRGNPYFSASLRAGLLHATASGAGYSNENAIITRKHEEVPAFSPFLGAGIRLGYPFARAWSVGLVAELDLVKNRSSLDVGQDNVFAAEGGRVEVAGSTLLVSGAMAALRYSIPTAWTPSAAESAPGAEAGGERSANASPWYVELAGGGQRLLGVSGRIGGDPAGAPDEGGTAPTVGLRVGYALDRQWALEGWASYVLATAREERTLVGACGASCDAIIELHYRPEGSAGVGAAWTPGGKGWFSAALNAGVLRAATEVVGWDYMTGRRQKEFEQGLSPYVGLEARGDYPITPKLDLGLRLGAQLVMNRVKAVVLEPDISTGVALDRKAMFAFPVSLAVRYRFGSEVAKGAGSTAPRATAPWYVELAGGGQKLLSVPGHVGNGSLDADSGDTGGTLGLRVGYALGSEWALEAWSSVLLETTASYRAPKGPGCSVATSYCDVTASYRQEGSGGVGAAWTPRGNRYFSMALSAGVVRTAVRTSGYRDFAGPIWEQDRDEGLSPLLALELRGDYPITPSLSAGIRVGAQVVPNRVTSSAGGLSPSYGDLGATVDSGPIWSLPASLALRYRF